MESSKKIVLFDGSCNLCNRSIQFVIKRDKNDEFRFATLQGDIGRRLVKERNIDTSKVDSIILIEPGVAYYTKSTAALKIGDTFGGIWKITSVLNLIPRQLRDIVYDWVAKNRYAWYGKKEQCMLPTPEIKTKFFE
ncbi:MAG: thiol-disulfide oxidoreductase DCC family protein [Maribacter sp.]|nr:thiol-disulfide oxidoreductase DCC family protein [Maribacter sp.]NNK76574.1 thiol-disulfide oxidoreductase DCC family protein [Maribacter sp.]